MNVIMFFRKCINLKNFLHTVNIKFPQPNIEHSCLIYILSLGDIHSILDFTPLTEVAGTSSLLVL